MPNLLVTFIASFLIWFMFAGLFFLWSIDGKIRKEQVIHALASSFLAWISAQLIKGLMPMERPFILNNLPTLTLSIPSDGSFPSAHSAAAFALAITIWLHNKKVGTLYLLAALAVGIGRVFGNVHYPLDILAGAILGSSVAFVTEKLHLYRFLGRKARP